MSDIVPNKEVLEVLDRLNREQGPAWAMHGNGLSIQGSTMALAGLHR